MMILGQQPRVKNKEISSPNRVALVATLVFLLALALIGRLAYLQIIDHGHYSSLAEGQHNTSYELLPDRGKIFIQENSLVNNSGLYPIAINKEFALIYAIPKNIENAEDTADKLYKFFQEEKVKQEVDLALKQEKEDGLKKELAILDSVPEAERAAKKVEIEAAYAALMLDPVYLDSQNQKREEMIKSKQHELTQKYLDSLNRSDSIYAPLEKKIDDEKLKSFYIFMSGRTDLTNVDLDIKDGKILIKKEENKELVLPGLAYSMAPYRFYPENNIGAHILGFANYEDDEQHGRYGLEGFFDNELFGKYGSVTAERGAGGTMIVNNRQYNKKEDGSSLVLTIDRSAQFTACRLLDESVKKHRAAGGSVIVVDPKTGAILVMCSAPDFDPNNYQDVANIKVFNNPAVFAQYEPGSVFKAITMAAALDSDKVTPDTTYQDNGQIMIKGWPKPIKNSDFATHGGHGKTTMTTVLEQSLNTGAIFAMEQVGHQDFADYVKRFGFGEKTGIELEGESSGNIKSITGLFTKEIAAATASFGQGITVTPLQMVMSYAAIANGGNLMKPYIVKEVIAPDGTRLTTQPSITRRVISERTAAILSGMLVNVVENGHSKGMQFPGYYVAGKTGTAQVASENGGGYGGKLDHTFVGFAPANNASFVILTELDNPAAMYAESTAVPLAHDISKFLINHWQIKQDRPIETPKKK
ncbi:MAG: penicillin-binding protein 2 [Candidatus Falkowbacteria bacterium]|nr:penicillin-binding protein 2 [Candidatus Falkowbacteria bacterium]